MPGRRTAIAGVITAALGAAALAFGIAHVRPAGTDAPAPETPLTVDRGHASDFASLLRTASAARGATVFRPCAACHSVGRGGPDLDGPNLYGVVGAGIAQRRERFGYTAALRAVGGAWTPARLDAWLTDPHRFAPGSRMPFAGMPDPRQRADVIAFLNQQGARGPLP